MHFCINEFKASDLCIEFSLSLRDYAILLFKFVFRMHLAKSFKSKQPSLFLSKIFICGENMGIQTKDLESALSLVGS